MESKLIDVVEIEDPRTQLGEIDFQKYAPLRNFRGNYGVPRLVNSSVIKGFFAADIKTLSKLEILQEAYHSELNKFLPTIQTNIHRDKERFYLTQPFIGGQTYEMFLQGNKTDKEKIDAYKILLTQALSFISHSEKIVGLDTKPENWILHNNKWLYIDTFPPLMIDEEKSFSQIFNLRDFEKSFAKNPENSYFRNKIKLSRRLWLKSEKFCANINFYDATISALSDFGLNSSSYFDRINAEHHK